MAAHPVVRPAIALTPRAASLTPLLFSIALPAGGEPSPDSVPPCTAPAAPRQQPSRAPTTAGRRPHHPSIFLSTSRSRASLSFWQLMLPWAHLGFSSLSCAARPGSRCRFSTDDPQPPSAASHLSSAARTHHCLLASASSAQRCLRPHLYISPPPPASPATSLGANKPLHEG